MQELPRISARPRPFLLRGRSSCTVETEGFSHTNKSLLPHNQIVAPVLFERLYGGIREKSIGYPRKVYRVFEKSLESFPKKSREFSTKVYRVFSESLETFLGYYGLIVSFTSNLRFNTTIPPQRYYSFSSRNSPVRDALPILPQKLTFGNRMIYCR